MDKVPKNQPNYYIDQLKKIDENDLKFVEKDLAFYEKVSDLFYIQLISLTLHFYNF